MKLTPEYQKIIEKYKGIERETFEIELLPEYQRILEKYKPTETKPKETKWLISALPETKVEIKEKPKIEEKILEKKPQILSIRIPEIKKETAFSTRAIVEEPISATTILKEVGIGATKDFLNSIWGLSGLWLQGIPLSKERKEEALRKWEEVKRKLEPKTPAEKAGAVIGNLAQIFAINYLVEKALISFPRIASFARKYPKLFNTFSFGLTGTAIGQLEMTPGDTWRKRLKEAGKDFAIWSSWGLVSEVIPARKIHLNFPAYFTVGYISAKLDGYSQKDAVISGMISAAIGSGLRYATSFLTPTRNILRERAKKILNKYKIKTHEDYIKAMRKWHPDRPGGNEKIASQINWAWQTFKKSPEELKKSVLEELKGLWREIRRRRKEIIPIEEIPVKEIKVPITKKPPTEKVPPIFTKAPEKSLRPFIAKAKETADIENFKKILTRQGKVIEFTEAIKAAGIKNLKEFWEKYGRKEEVPEVKLKEEKPIKKPEVPRELLAKLEKSIAEDEAELRRVYHLIGSKKVEKALGEIWDELDIAEKGERIPIRDEEGYIISWMEKESSFPKWIPKHLRSKKLFEKVMSNLDIDTLKYPTGKRSKQRALYDAILDELDQRLNINTEHIRSSILEKYEKLTKTAKPSEIEEIISRSPPRGIRFGEEGEEIKPEEIFGKIPEKIKKKKPKEDAFIPRNLLKPITENFKKETEKIVRRSEIAEKIKKEFGIAIRRGKFRIRGAVGIYKHKGVIRIKKDYLRTISHELGHYLFKTFPRFFLPEDISIEERENLLTEYLLPEDRLKLSSLKKAEEAFSEFLRFWITEPSKAQKYAPNFTRKFEKILKEKLPEIGEVLYEIRRDYQRWKELPATARVLSHISFKEEKLGVKERFTDFLNKLYIHSVDDLYPLKKLEETLLGEKIEKLVEKGEIDPFESPYILARLLKGNISKANIFLEKGTFGKKFWKIDNKGNVKIVFKGKGLRQILQPLEEKEELTDFSVYLVAKRTLELNKRKIETGISTQDAKETIKELEKKYPHFPHFADDLYTYQKHLLEYISESGLIDLETLRKLLKLSKAYVPFYRVFDELASKGYLGKTLANVFAPLRRIKGSEKEIINPLESIVKNTYVLINAADRNQVGIAMANLISKYPEALQFFEPIPVPMARVAKVSAEDLGITQKDVLNYDVLNVVVDIFRPSMFIPKDNVVVVLMNGKKKYFQTTPEIYRALMASDRQTLGLLGQLLRMPASWLRAGATLYPEFAVRNPLRDQLTAFCYSKWNFIPGIDFIKGIFKLLKQTDEYWLWRASGGEHSMLVSVDRKYLKHTLKEILEKHPEVKYINPKNTIELLRIISELSEKPTRLAESAKGLKRIKNPLLAAYASRELTLDFARAGHTGRALNSIIAFFNAYIQGWDKLIREFRLNPIRMAIRIFFLITLPSILLYLRNRRDSRWKEIPQWQKDLFWIIMTEKNIYRIPKPFELGILFGSLPERILEYLERKDPYILKKFEESLIEQLPDFLPTAVKPIVENLANYNFFLKRPIIPYSKKELPPEEQYTRYTSEIAKKIGKFVHYSPAKIENLLYGYFGGLGRYATQTLDEILEKTGISSKIPEPSPTLADKPVIRAFIVRRPIGSASESVNRFYEVYSKLESWERAAKQAIQERNKEKLLEIKRKHPEIYLSYDWERKVFYSQTARFCRKVARQVAQLRKIEYQIYNSKKLTPEEKRKKIDALDELITKITRQALDYLSKLNVK